MYRYILKRVAIMELVLIGVTLVVYFIVDKTPGSPAAMILGNAATPESIVKLEEDMGLKDPLPGAARLWYWSPRLLAADKENRAWTCGPLRFSSLRTASSSGPGRHKRPACRQR